MTGLTEYSRLQLPLRAISGCMVYGACCSDRPKPSAATITTSAKYGDRARMDVPKHITIGKVFRQIAHYELGRNQFCRIATSPTVGPSLARDRPTTRPA